MSRDLLYNLNMNFHRYYTPGSAVFITQVVHNSEPIFRSPDNVILFRQTLRTVRVLHPFSLLAYVFLPDHFHMVIQPTGESTASQIMHCLKPDFGKAYTERMGLPSAKSIELWQKRFWDRTIQGYKDFENHLHYIHYNPVKHGYVEDPRDWPNSSYIEWEKRGLYHSRFKWDEPQDMTWGE